MQVESYEAKILCMKAGSTETGLRSPAGRPGASGHGCNGTRDQRPDGQDGPSGDVRSL